MKNKGKIHIYTGNGKGKTTAALGLAIRASGAGKTVYIAQFVKGMHYSELETLKKIDNITIKQYGLECFIKNEPQQKDIDAAKNGLKEIKKNIKTQKIDLLILDEICIAIDYNLLEINELNDIFAKTNEGMELVLTGRNAGKELYSKADLITEMKEIKHYYNEGTIARIGIEY